MRSVHCAPLKRHSGYFATEWHKGLRYTRIASVSLGARCRPIAWAANATLRLGNLNLLIFFVLVVAILAYRPWWW
jgi:hypothetical protein